MVLCSTDHFWNYFEESNWKWQSISYTCKFGRNLAFYQSC